MQTANVMVALSGDRGTTVPKYRITAAEIAVLRAIHGVDAVHDIEPADDKETSDRDEWRYLGEIYGKPDPLDTKPSVVQRMFPNATGMPRALDDLELDESLFKAIARAKPKPAKAEAPAPKSRKAKVEEPEPEQEELFG